MTEQDKTLRTHAEMAETFGPLSLVMLNDTGLRHAWRMNFIANFFTGPVYRQLDAQFAISRPEFVILYCLKHRPGLVARDICLVTGQPKNSISRAVSDLLEKGYIARGTDPADKRAKPLSLTERGRRVLDQVIPIVEARQARMRQVLSADEQAQFDQLISKIVCAMPTWAAPE